MLADNISMALPFSIAISSMNAATTGLRTTANNIANVSTDGFTQSRVQFAALPNGNGVKVATITEDPAITSGVDLTEQLLKMIEYFDPVRGPGKSDRDGQRSCEDCFEHIPP